MGIQPSESPLAVNELTSQTLLAPSEVNRQVGSSPFTRILSLIVGSRSDEAARINFLFKAMVIVIGIAAYLWWTYTDVIGVWMTLAAVAFAVVVFVRPGIETRSLRSFVLTAIVVSSGIIYWLWRLRSLNMVNWWIAVPLFAAEGFGMLHQFGFFYTIWPRREAQLDLRDDPSLFPIYIFIPTVNEGLTILEPTLRGAIAARDRYMERYPHGQVTIVICNDGFVANAANWHEPEALADKYGVVCITRQVKGGAKAGNIENARRQVGATDAALVAIFDSDQIPDADFLIKTVPPFADPTIGWVQTGQYYRNLDNVIARWANDQQALFYKLLCPGKSSLNSVFICGTNVVIRGKALDQIGGLPQESITEDMAASLLLHADWRSIFLSERLATGLGPVDLHSYFAQQRRWATGNLKILRSHWRELILPGRSKMQAGQRFQYVLACTHYLCGVRDLIYIVTPLFYLVLKASAIDFTSMSTFLSYAIPYWIVSQLAFWAAVNGYAGMRGVLLNFASFPIFVSSLFAAMTDRQLGFQVTAKRRTRNHPLRYIQPHLLMLGLCVPGLIFGLARLNSNPAPILMSLFWLVFQMTYLGSILWLAIADIRMGSQRQVQGRLESWRSRWLPRPLLQRSALFAGVVLFLALSWFVGVPLLSRVTVGSLFTAAAPKDGFGKPHLAIVLPYELLSSREIPAGESNSSLSVVSRTFNVDDQFDPAWAEETVKRDALPWIQLLFGKQGNREDFDNSLVAIANGVRDTDIRRWAQQLRSYAHPVYLTIFPDVDRPWGLPSATRYDARPQDVGPAWQHVQRIFKEQGVQNVAWVWRPADPGSDTRFAPPLETIDIEYIQLHKAAGDSWDSVQTVLDTLQQRSAHLSLFVEVGVSGTPAEQAMTIKQISTMFDTGPQSHAFVFVR